jgi:hypothetical protein
MITENSGAKYVPNGSPVTLHYFADLKIDEGASKKTRSFPLTRKQIQYSAS